MSASFAVKAGNAVPREFLNGDFVHIVEHGVVSKFALSADGRITEVGMVGREGCFPLCSLLGVPPISDLAISQVGMLHGRRVRTSDFHRIVREDKESSDLLSRYISSFMAQIASNIMASDQAMVKARIARWLLMCHDRIDGHQIEVTHDGLAQMAGAHRPTVSNTLQAFKAKGLIDTSRGFVTVLRRGGLRSVAGGTYGSSEGYWQAHIGRFGRSDDDGGHFSEGRRALLRAI